ncbi:MAG TPA: 2Fe-2S iron-sulfur cluster binding domain-containing protein [Chromatiales bacterium]|jgi:CDP-4-dehydro-6-deoxyglucose reductase|nr:2Fe-2S iron-sulfur cluster binding domain-containing protein [Chromatiaceae bacterium]HIO13642.1 2Fe-2S iron-sulfur cluster binding domain-containing protein [Chromatiales bacterium]HIO54661.1 2Fe-2S iron-sulfur cluster binding domain-containing protein [Chromatiales bacterium]
MPFTVTIQPSGHHFEIDEHETVLEAGLRAGMNLNYSCSGGSCGDCKGRIIKGELASIEHHDFQLSEADKSAGGVLLCRAKPASDLVIEAFEYSRPEDIPVQEIETKVTKIERVAEHIMLLQLRTPRSSTLHFLAGQHVTLLADGIRPRNKSVASCPCNAMHLQFHIRDNPDDEFSQYIFEALKTSSKLNIRGPWGSFILDEESERPIIMIAYDIGFGPIKSLIEHAVALELDQGMHLYWITSEEDGHYMDNYCRSWADAFDEFIYTSLGRNQHVEPEDLEADFLRRMRIIREDHSDLSGYDFYVTAPGAAIESAKALLVEWGAAAEHIRVDSLERF